MDGNLPGYSVHGIFQARILEWVAIFPSPEDLPDPGIKPVSPALAGIFFTTDHQGSPLFLFTSPQILSLRFDLALAYRGWDFGTKLSIVSDLHSHPRTTMKFSPFHVFLSLSHFILVAELKAWIGMFTNFPLRTRNSYISLNSIYLQYSIGFLKIN